MVLKWIPKYIATWLSNIMHWKISNITEDKLYEELCTLADDNTENNLRWKMIMILKTNTNVFDWTPYGERSAKVKVTKMLVMKCCKMKGSKTCLRYRRSLGRDYFARRHDGCDEALCRVLARLGTRKVSFLYITGSVPVI